MSSKNAQFQAKTLHFRVLDRVYRARNARFQMSAAASRFTAGAGAAARKMAIAQLRKPLAATIAAQSLEWRMVSESTCAHTYHL